MGGIRVGIVGAGRFTQTAILPVLKRMNDVEVVGIVSRTEERVRQVAYSYGIPRYSCSLEDLIKDMKPDCAFVLTSPDAHKAATVRLLESGIDVFCEKPLAADLPSAEEMVDTAKRAGRILMVGLNRRYSPTCVKAKEEFHGKKIEGCVVEKFKRNVDRRALINDGIHLLDLMRWFCGGDYIEVSAVGAFEKDPYHEQTVAAIVKFSTGAIGTFFMNRNAGQWKERFELHGSGLTTIIDWPDELRVLSEGRAEVRDFKPADWAWAADPLERGGFRQEIEDFIDCVRGQRQPITTGEDVIKSHRLVWEIYQKCGLPLT